MSIAHLFHNNHEVQLVKRPVKDGEMVVEHRLFNLSKAIPFLKKGRLGTMSVYFLKWDSICPTNVKGFNNSPAFTDVELILIWERRILNFVTKSVQFFGGTSTTMKYVLTFIAGAVVYYLVRTMGIIETLGAL